MKKISHDQVLEYFNYDLDSGSLIWRRSCGTARKGTVAGSPSDERGYIRVQVLGQTYYAHQLIWFYVTGKWPTSDIDHIDSSTANNRWSNLREATRSQNVRNTPIRRDNTSGVRGVSFHKRHRLWCAYITSAGSRRHLGWFPDFDAAVSARHEAELEWGEFRYKPHAKTFTLISQRGP